jgi:hypothetical protein
MRLKPIMIPALLLLGLWCPPARSADMPPIKPDDVKHFLALLEPTSLDQEFCRGYVFTGVSVDKNIISYIFEKGDKKCRLTLGDRRSLPRAGQQIGFVQLVHSCTPPAGEDEQELLRVFQERLGSRDRLLQLIQRIGSDWRKQKRARTETKAPAPPFFPGPVLLVLLGLFLVYYLTRVKRIIVAFRSLSPGTRTVLYLGVAATILLTCTMNPQAGPGFRCLAAGVSSVSLLLLFALGLRQARGEADALLVLVWVAVCPAFQRMAGKDPAGLFFLLFVLAAVEGYLAFRRDKKVPDLCGSCLGAVSIVLLLALGLVPGGARLSMLTNPELVDPVYLLLVALGLYAFIVSKTPIWIGLGLLAVGALVWPALFLLVALGILAINRKTALTRGKLVLLHLLLGAPLLYTQLVFYVISGRAGP